MANLTYEYCYNVAKKYNNYNTFRLKENNSVYNKTIRNGWIKDYTWLKRGVRDNTNNIIYVYEFKDLNYAYIGRTMNIQRRNYQHLNDIKDSVYNFILLHNIPKDKVKYQILEENLTIEKSAEKECEYIDLYKNNKWNLINIAQGGSIGGFVVKWTFEECKNKAKEFHYLKDFYDNYPFAANKSARNGWLKEFTWLERFKPKNIYSYDECLEVAKKCNTWYQFKNKFSSYYSFAKRNNWLKDYTWIKLNKHDKIVEYDINGNFIQVLDKLPEKNGSYVIKCAKGEHKFHNNKIYRYLSNVLDKNKNIIQHVQVDLTPSYYRPIVQYDYHGHFIAEYPCIKSCGFNSTTISASLQHETIGAKGFIWRYKNEVIDNNGNIIQDIIVRENNCNKQIVHYDINGNFIKIYNSQTEAIKEGFKRNWIEQSTKLNDKPNKFKGYWRLKKDIMNANGVIPQKLIFC
jgi:predicted GIY-YIG superfamily endonuclease